MRPGCSESQTRKKKSDDYEGDDRYNVLANYDIEMNDGNPGYYGAGDDWVLYEKDSDGMIFGGAAEDYEEQEKKNLESNSYPSGHSSGMWAGALTLMEIMPDKADLIMKEANEFAVNRTIARYHWNSDTIQGRVLASTVFPVAHATKNYDSDRDKAIQEAKS